MTQFAKNFFPCFVPCALSAPTRAPLYYSKFQAFNQTRYAGFLIALNSPNSPIYAIFSRKLMNFAFKLTKGSFKNYVYRVLAFLTPTHHQINLVTLKFHETPSPNCCKCSLCMTLKNSQI